MKKIIFLIAITCFTQNVSASKDFALKAVAHANGSLMANPPMPQLFGKQGDSKLLLRPSVFSASNEDHRDVDPKIVDYSGTAAAIMYYNQFSERSGYFVIGMGTQLSGEFTSPGEVVGDPDYIIYANDVESSSYQASIGMYYSLIKQNHIEVQLLAGPAWTKTKVQQTIVQNDPANPDDFDMSLEPSLLTYFAGVQMGYKFSDYFVINPYFVISDLVNSSDRCQTYSSVVRVHGNLFDLGDQNCYEGNNSSTSKIEYDTSFSSIGLNAYIPKWGLTINLFSDTGDIPFFGGVSMDMYYIDFSFSI